MPAVQRLSPPVVGWSQWYADQRLTWSPGQHRFFVGPTQSGKTTLCRLLVRYRNYVIVLGTKAKDDSLDEYIREGYTRIYQWPPKPKDLRRDEDGNVKLILWPKITSIPDLWRFRDVYAKCLNSAFIDGGWTLVLDEGIWLGSRGGLNLGQEIAAISYGAASNKVTMCLLAQRPSGIPPISYTNVSDAMIFHGGYTRDIRELASLGTNEPRDVTAAIQHLRGRQFLDLPMRGGREWAITEVEL